ncbi:glycoside hydrolase family 16 protein [Streptosporangium sp. NPDC051022]|uniref:glycoside hydrolase family 16 protein n=1 Tax=Streptosporangium sp. NPDC051022 TaxID=3155752 RepID=UPI003447B71B
MDKQHTQRRRVLLAGAGAGTVVLTAVVGVAGVATAAPVKPKLAAQRQLVGAASDEFTGSALDTAKWKTGLWYAKSGVGAFTDANVGVADGNLVLTAKKEAYNGSPYTFGAVESKFDVPGDSYVEVRAKVLDSRANVLSAIWLQSSPLSVQNNPNPEIDIHETFSYRRMVSTLHRWVWPYSDKSHLVDGDKRFDFGVTDTSTGYHVYGLERRNGRLRFYADGRLGWDVAAPDPSYVNMARHMVLSLEGHLGQPNDAYLPSTFLIDYVRTYGYTGGAGVKGVRPSVPTPSATSR